MNRKALLARETGAVFKHAARLKVALIYPDTYRVGMSNLGYQTMYFHLNSRRDTWCQRFFHEPGVKPLSIETGEQLSRFDIAAFALSYERDLPNCFEMLTASGIPCDTASRSPNHPLVIAGGAVTNYRTDIFSGFADFVVTGEAEESVHSCLDVISSHTGPRARASTRDITEELLRVDGIYVPGLSPSLKPARIADLDRYETVTAVLTPDTEFSNVYLIEVSRGCPRTCKFCVTRSCFGSYRRRSSANIIASAAKGLKLTRRIGLVGAAVSDYPGIDALCGELLSMGARISVSSLRIDAASHTLLRCLALSGQNTVTFAPEAGTERLRSLIGKPMTDETVVSSIENARSAGLRKCKLYFMVGLPQEEDEDVIAIGKLVKRLSRIMPVKVKVGTFVPKPGTPFAAFVVPAPSLIKQRVKLLRKQGIRFKFERSA